MAASFAWDALREDNTYGAFSPPRQQLRPKHVYLCALAEEPKFGSLYVVRPASLLSQHRRFSLASVAFATVYPAWFFFSRCSPMQ